MANLKIGESKKIRAIISRLLPKAVTHPLLRSFLNLPSTLDQNLVLKVAETKDELQQAFGLLYTAYLKENFTKPNTARMRITKYHALPSTSILIAKRGGTVVGTVSIIRSSQFGFPMQKIFEIPSNLPPGSCMAEISSLAIDRTHAGNHGEVLFALFKFLYHYCVDYFGVSHLLIAVNPSWIEFYQAVLGFDKIALKPVENYDFVNGAPAVGAILEFKKVARQYPLMYQNKITQKDLYEFMVNKQFDNFLFPQRKKSLIADPYLNPELMKHFFVDQLPILESMSDEERQILRQIYKEDEYLHLIPEPKVINESLSRRTDPRFETNIDAYALDSANVLHKLRLVSVSKTGVRAISYSPMNKDSVYSLFFNADEFQKTRVRIKCAWSSEGSENGMLVSEKSSSWENFIDMIDSYHNTRKAVPTPISKKAL